VISSSFNLFQSEKLNGVVATGAKSSASVNWVVYSDPTNRSDDAYCIAEYGDYIYVGGSIDGGEVMRFEKRLKEDGRLVKEWNYDPSSDPNYVRNDEILDCLVVKDKLYAVGYVTTKGGLRSEWVIIVFDLDLNILKYEVEDPSSFADLPTSITSDGEFLYIAGLDMVPYMENYNPTQPPKPNVDRCEWRVEKRRLDDLSLIKVYKSNPGRLERGRYSDGAYGIGVNPITGHLWVVGSEAWIDERGNIHLSGRIEILNKNLNLIKAITYIDYPHFIEEDSISHIVFDEEGNAYAFGHGDIIKFDKDGNEISRVELTTAQVMDIGLNGLYANGYLFAVSCENIGGFYRSVLYVLDKDLNVMDKIILSEDIEADSFTGSGHIVFDDENVYIPACSQGLWIVYGVAFTPSTAPITPTYVARVIEAVFPEAVNSGQTFKVDVTIEYNFTSSNDVMIQVYEHAGPLLAQKIDKLYGAGMKTYSFTLTAPLEPKTWRLNIHTFYRGAGPGGWNQTDIRTIYI